MAWLRGKVSGGGVMGASRGVMGACRGVMGACRGVVGASRSVVGARGKVLGAGGRKPTWRSVASMIGTMIGAPVD